MTLYMREAKPEDNIFGIRPLEYLGRDLLDMLEPWASDARESITPASDSLSKRLTDGIAGLAPMPKEPRKMGEAYLAEYAKRISFFFW